MNSAWLRTEETVAIDAIEVDSVAILAVEIAADLVVLRPDLADRHQDSAEEDLAVLREASVVVVLAGHPAVSAAVTVKADSAR
jgi:hypothetical protein